MQQTTSRIESHTAVAYRVVVGSAVEVAAPIVAVTHTGEVLAAVWIVMVIAGSMVVAAVHWMTTEAGSGHGPCVIPPALRAVLLPRVVPCYQVQSIFFLLKRWEARFLTMGFQYVACCKSSSRMKAEG